MTSTILLPGLHLVAPVNQRRHFMARARDAKLHRDLVLLKLPRRLCPPLPVCVRFVRIAPRSLDDDNLRGAMKHVRDSVAWRLLGEPLTAAGKPAWGRGDSDPRITWEYAQESAGVREYGVRIEIDVCPPF